MCHNNGFLFKLKGKFVIVTHINESVNSEYPLCTNVAADLDIDQSTMSCKDLKSNKFPLWFLKISEPKLIILWPMFFHYFSLGNFFGSDQFDFGVTYGRKISHF